jgi:uncharacterized surface protein with fasciclin (FAS1) repeats
VIAVKRIGVVIATAALAASLAACGGGSESSAPPAQQAPPPAAAAPSSEQAAPSDGVTKASDTFGAACSKLPQGNAPGSLDSMGPQPVATAASTNPLLTTLVKAVGAAGLADTLNQQKAITVFAPYNGAFEEVQKALGTQKFNALLADKTALGSVLKYHVIAQRYDRQGLVTAASVPTLAGGDLQIKDAGSTITVTDGSGQTANVLCGNVPTANATVFVIDKVLMAKKS